MYGNFDADMLVFVDVTLEVSCTGEKEDRAIKLILVIIDNVGATPL